jgi:hypothetical protein
MHWEKRNANRILIGKTEIKRQLGKPKPLLEDNIKMELGEIRWNDINWIDLAQDRN